MTRLFIQHSELNLSFHPNDMKGYQNICTCFVWLNHFWLLLVLSKAMTLSFEIDLWRSANLRNRFVACQRTVDCHKWCSVQCLSISSCIRCGVRFNSRSHCVIGHLKRKYRSEGSCQSGLSSLNLACSQQAAWWLIQLHGINPSCFPLPTSICQFN